MKHMILTISAALALTGCATAGNDVRLNANKAFLTSQIALSSAQQTVAAACSIPEPPKQACNKAIDILHTGAQAEAAGYTALKAGNSSDAQTAIQTLIDLPSQLVALGLIEGSN